jgi:nitrite reductase/ring-hydroxylating ferredoxin subunit
MVLSRGIIGDTAGIPKVTCPMHKKSFSLKNGRGLGENIYSIQTFQVKVEGDDLLVQLPSEENLDLLHLCDTEVPCSCFA